jgi:putative ABC transport system substrate-binding protein
MIARRPLLAALAAPGLARAQGTARRRIGFVHPITLEPNRISAVNTLRPIWRRLGYVEGETVLLRTAAGDPARLPGIMAELIAREVSVIIAVGAETVRAAAAASRSMPVVAIDLETDPVATGLARSLARPGGNVTGMFLDQPAIAGKWIELLGEVAPGLRRVVLVRDPSTGTAQYDAARSKAMDRGYAVETLDWRATPDFDAAIAGLADGSTGLVALTAPGFNTVVARIGPPLLRHRLIMLASLRQYIGSGILLSYGPEPTQFWGRAMVPVERILAGQSPAELPIEQPTRFELVLDLRAARTIGANLPFTLLAQADEVIE